MKRSFTYFVVLSPVVRQLADRSLYNRFMWIIYVLYNPTVGKIYIGQTKDIERRLFEHNQKEGNHFTAKYKGEWKLLYQEKADSHSEVLKREKQLKSYRGREYIKQFIPKELDISPVAQR